MYTQPTSIHPLTNKRCTELLICAAKGYIIALQKSDGRVIWKLKIGSSTSTISLFVTDNDTIIAGTLNKTHSIDLMTGKINWINTLILVEHKDVTVLAIPSLQLQYQPFNMEENEFDLPPPYESQPSGSQPSQSQLSGSQSSESRPSESLHTPFILSFSKGLVIAIHPKTGITQWRYSIPLKTHHNPVAIVEPPTKYTNKSLVFIGISSTVYSLDGETGTLNWATQVSYISSGSNYMALASSWNSKLAVEIHTSFS